MADYRELLRRAISALPENNGAARRAVYEKARTALVGQLRAIQPPLPARDITQHRLQLEDCIRQVEQEASEAVISLGRETQAAARPSFAPTPAPPRAAPQPVPPPVVVEEPEPEPVSAKPEPIVAQPEPARSEPARSQKIEPEPQPVHEPEPQPEPPAAPASVTSIEDIIAAASAATAIETPPAATRDDRVPVQTPSIIPIPARTLEPIERKGETAPTRPSFFTPRRDNTAPMQAASAAAITAPIIPIPGRPEPSLGNTALVQQPANNPLIEPTPVAAEPAMSSVRDVEIETDTREAEGAIERAIETLDREARGEATEPLPEDRPLPLGVLDETTPRPEDAAFAAADAETRSGAGLTIFLVVAALLLVGVGGAGFWAWREGYVDLDQMFGRGQPVVTEQAQTSDPTVPTMDTPTSTDVASSDEGAAGPGNTATTQATEPTSALEGLEIEDRLEPTPEAVTPTGTETVLPSIDTGEVKTEERLSGADTTIAATDDPAASVDPVNLAGNQSLLLEASADGQSGAVPFSGTVDWTEGTDELGGPTLVGRASIPARNLGVTMTIRKNNDPVLPASHLMEISFDVPDTFIGGSVATLAGVLLKDEELVPGTALKGAAARVVGNSFLFALSASEADVASNTTLLEDRRWLDLAVVYGTGRNAILTLEKDEEAQELFDRVLTAWAQ